MTSVAASATLDDVQELLNSALATVGGCRGVQRGSDVGGGAAEVADVAIEIEALRRKHYMGVYLSGDPSTGATPCMDVEQ